MLPNIYDYPRQHYIAANRKKIGTPHLCLYWGNDRAETIKTPLDTRKNV